MHGHAVLCRDNFLQKCARYTPSFVQYKIHSKAQMEAQKNIFTGVQNALAF